MSAERPYKISTLIYLRNEADELLLLQRTKSPNAGLWSPIGGKLEMASGESPFEAARRETAEEVGLEVDDADLHLFGMISEKNYEGRVHWLMFLFDCRRRLTALPTPIGEGRFGFFAPTALDALAIPATDRKLLWPHYFAHRAGFAAIRVDCSPGHDLTVVTEQAMPGPAPGAT